MSIIPNRWHLRRVADTSTKPCYVCYKPTASVLITADNKDFFYICNGHLTDKGFCSPIIDQEALEKAAQEAREREIEKVKAEYEAKQKKKKEKERKEKQKQKEKDNDKEKSKDEADDKAEKAELDTTKSAKLQEEKFAEKVEDTPRIFALNKSFYQMRLNRLRSAELAKRNRERLRNPTAFPSVPKGDP